MRYFHGPDTVYVDPSRFRIHDNRPREYNRFRRRGIDRNGFYYRYYHGKNVIGERRPFSDKRDGLRRTAKQAGLSYNDFFFVYNKFKELGWKLPPANWNAALRVAQRYV